MKWAVYKGVAVQKELTHIAQYRTTGFNYNSWAAEDVGRSSLLEAGWKQFYQNDVRQPTEEEPGDLLGNYLCLLPDFRDP